MSPGGPKQKQSHSLKPSHFNSLKICCFPSVICKALGTITVTSGITDCFYNTFCVYLFRSLETVRATKMHTPLPCPRPTNRVFLKCPFCGFPYPALESNPSYLGWTENGTLSSTLINLYQFLTKLPRAVHRVSSHVFWINAVWMCKECLSGMQ